MAIKRFTRLEMSFNAVERIVEFMEIDQESPAVTNIRPPPGVRNDENTQKLQNLTNIIVANSG